MKIICPFCDKEFEETEATPAETSIVTIKKGPGGRIDEWTEERRDRNSKLLGKRTDVYAYYETGEIHVITQKEFDENAKLVSEKDVLHFKDGRPPKIMNRISVEEQSMAKM